MKKVFIRGIFALLLSAVGMAHAQDEDEYLFEWEIPLPTAEQVMEARECAIEDLAEELYGGIDDLTDISEPESACEWAALAAAHRNLIPEGEEPGDDAREVFRQVVAQNPAFLLREEMMFVYIGMGNLVEAHPLTLQPLQSVTIHHTYSGIGSTVEYDVEISEADSESPVVTVEVSPDTSTMQPEDDEADTEVVFPETIDPEIVQALGASLTDLIPIEAQFTGTFCWDNYPDWNVTLTYEDGTEVELSTNDGNFFFFGGPWQAEIDDANYVQFSPALVEAMIDLVKALELPQGTTAAMGCGGFYEAPLELAFPSVPVE